MTQRGHRRSACIAWQEECGGTQDQAVKIGSQQDRILAAAYRPSRRDQVQRLQQAEAYAGPKSEVEGERRVSDPVGEQEYRRQTYDHGAADGRGLEYVGARYHRQIAEQGERHHGQRAYAHRLGRGQLAGEQRKFACHQFGQRSESRVQGRAGGADHHDDHRR